MERKVKCDVCLGTAFMMDEEKIWCPNCEEKRDEAMLELWEEAADMDGP